MTVKDIYLFTDDCEAVEVHTLKDTIYLGCSADIPSEIFGMIIHRITHNDHALVIEV